MLLAKSLNLLLTHLHHIYGASIFAFTLYTCQEKQFIDYSVLIKFAL
jgi:hypothetical protein